MISIDFRWFFIFGTVFHLVYILSIFDIYFKSPIIHGMEPFAPQAQPPAKRLVVFVADGCRADKFFEADDKYMKEGRDLFFQAVNRTPEAPTATTVPTRIPFLRHIIDTTGSYGVSHTRVPTESRPGHVAMFAGFYEDVSAVAKGWQENPVEFDSIFNESSNAWLFGSPDIVPMFAKNHPNVHEYYYSHEEEDFAKEAAHLDVWVYQQVRMLLDQAKKNDTLNNQLRQEQVVFFFHLLGLDTNGHAYRPYSKEYLSNLAVMDCVVEETTKLLNEFYDHDDQTAFIVSADHGMSNKGAHGDGDPTNTRTPVVAWGAGIAKPQVNPHQDTLNALNPSLRQIQNQYDQVSEEYSARRFHFQHPRKDLMQADLSPLFASLIGIPMPLNSVGVLPVQYLDAGKYRTAAMLANLREIFSQLHLKSRLKKAIKVFYFVEFEHFDHIQRRLHDLHQAVDTPAASYDAIEAECFELIRYCLDGLEYYQKYDYLFLMGIITLGYIEWIILQMYMIDSNFALEWTSTSSISFIVIGFCTLMYLAMEQAQLNYYLYSLFPVCFSSALVPLMFRYSRQVAQVWAQINFRQLLSLFLGVECIVYGYLDRRMFSVLFLAVGIIGYSHPGLRYQWFGWCLLLSVFPMLPSEYGEHPRLVYGGGFVLVVVMAYIRSKLPKTLSLTLLYLGSTAIAVGCVALTMWYLLARTKPPTLLFIVNWILGFVPPVVLTWSNTRAPSAREHAIQIYLAFAPVFILLSISYEVFFYVGFCCCLLCWMAIEVRSKKEFTTFTYATEIRLAFIYFLFSKVAFFGTGNIASMSSFELSSTYRFLTVFAPFTMGALIIYKICVPRILAMATLQLICYQLNKECPRVLLWVLLMSDVLCINFFFLVRDEGSWKEIGNSISMFGIVSAQIIVIPLMFFLAQGFTRSFHPGHRAKRD